MLQLAHKLRCRLIVDRIMEVAYSKMDPMDLRYVNQQAYLEDAYWNGTGELISNFEKYKEVTQNELCQFLKETVEFKNLHDDDISALVCALLDEEYYTGRVKVDVERILDEDHYWSF